MDGHALCGVSDTLGETAVLFGLGVAAVVAFVLVLLLVWRCMSAKLARRFQYFNSTFTPKNKLKIIAGCYQLTTKVSSVYDVSLPPDVNEFLNSLSTGLTFGMQGLASTPLACLGLQGYMYVLIFWMALPVVMLLIVVLAVAVSGLFRANRKVECGNESQNHQHT